jgi:hypothetical protein
MTSPAGSGSRSGSRSKVTLIIDAPSIRKLGGGR